MLQTATVVYVVVEARSMKYNIEIYCMDYTLEFARKLELNNQDTFLHVNPSYICDTQNFEEILIDSETKLNMFDLRYYRTNPNGVDKLLEAKRDKHLIGQKLFFRSPMTCASAAKGKGVCYKCYGDLAYVNREVNIGQIASESLSSRYTQTLLSAKHLLESNVKQLNWPSVFYDLFVVNFTTICLKPNLVCRDWKVVIDEDIKTEEELDDIQYNYYINSFLVRKPDGTEIRIHTAESDNLYIDPDVYNFITNPKNNGVDIDEDTGIEIDMVQLLNFDVLFIIELKNNELSRTMNNIKKLIDNKSVMAEYDRNTILESFINTNIQGRITLNSVHFEILLMNQIRSIDDDLDMPDWSRRNEPYKMIPLSKALSNNRSITVRLEASNISKALLNPNNDLVHRPSISDLYFMEQPQEFLNKDMISDEYKPINDVEDNIVEPFSFRDKSIKVGREVNKKRIPKSQVTKE